MWYFSWILGLGLASMFGVLNAIWYEIGEMQLQSSRQSSPPPAPLAGTQS